ncbi:SGNH/GDSL hydrolase family protein [Sphingomonas sp. RT2P30]|uniref:GDSL-type esterase/lipase family protein n=1 Tax=Parasphingomonas halimpatiens TaxID=3096162 RepID=UPI002FCB4663
MKHIPLMIAAFAALVPAPALAARCVGPVCDGERLAPIFSKLAAARRGQGPAVHILQIGDSHTAGDAVTGAWRDLLQARYGVGGRGVLAPGRPYDGYLTRGVTATMSVGWTIGATFGKSAAAPRPMLGVAGFSMIANRPDASMTLRADSSATMFDRFVLCAIGGPNAGGVTLRFDGAETSRIDFTAPDVRPMCRSVDSATMHGAIDVTAEIPGLTLTSWATFRSGKGGVVLSNVGVVGSQLMHFARADDIVIAEEMTTYAPDLIVLAFGTNEGFSPRFDAVSYEATLRAQIARLRLLSGGAPMLMFGAPDSLTRNAALRGNAPGLPLECEAAPAFLAAPLPSDAMVQPLPGDGAAPAAKAPLFAPPALADVRRIQRRVAADMGVAFWDWQASMGGPCAARDWVQRAEPLMRGDYVHFKTLGGREIARRLQADLDAALASPR